MFSLTGDDIIAVFVEWHMTTELDVQIPQGLLTANWQAPEQGEMAIPDKQERARQFNKWFREYEDIQIGNWPSMICVTVTVAGATFAESIDVFPSVDLYVKIALAVNTGNLKRRKRVD